MKVGKGYPNTQMPIPVIFIAMAFSILGTGIGVSTLRSFPYEVMCDSSGLSVSFLFRKEQVSWKEIEWYKNISGCVYVWILLKYHSTGKGGVRVRRAVLLLPSIGSTLSWSPKDYVTMLDQYIPNKKKGLCDF